MRSEKVTIGKIVSPHGVKGLFKVLVYSENEDSFFSHKSYFKVKNKKIDIIKKFNKGIFIVCESATIQSRDQVNEIINEDIVISATDLKKNYNNKNLKLSPYIPYSKISSKIKKIDVFVLPYTSKVTVSGDIGDISKYTSPLKVFDYMICGKLLICSNLSSSLSISKISCFWSNEIFKIATIVSDILFRSDIDFMFEKDFFNYYNI